jgi:hypothetical protein
MATREKATPSAGARSKASGSTRDRAGAAPSTAKPAAKPAAGASRGKAASLRFHAGWREELEGEIVPGGKLRVEYAPDRLPDYRGTHKNKPTWDIVATVLFSPGGQVQSGSVAKKPFEIAVPRDASEVTLWFQNTDGSGGAAWDSRYGENYRFGVSSGGVAPASVSRAAGGTAGRAKSAAASSAGAASGGQARGASAARGATSARASGTRSAGGATNGSAPRGSASRARGS